MIIDLFLDKPCMWQASAVTHSQEQRSSMLLPQTEIQEYMELSHMNWSQENFLLFSQWMHPQVLYESMVQIGYNYTMCFFWWYYFFWSHGIRLKPRFCWKIILEEDGRFRFNVNLLAFTRINRRMGNIVHASTIQDKQYVTYPLFSAINLFIGVSNNKPIIFYNNTWLTEVFRSYSWGAIIDPSRCFHLISSLLS